MVAVRSAHLNKAGEFDPQKWIASLGISSQQSCERLTETWAYCLRTTQGHPDAELIIKYLLRFCCKTIHTAGL